MVGLVARFGGFGHQLDGLLDRLPPLDEKLGRDSGASEMVTERRLCLRYVAPDGFAVPAYSWQCDYLYDEYRKGLFLG